jgi:lipoprotein-anchoring transpeptidase ErfK/SrfK
MTGSRGLVSLKRWDKLRGMAEECVLPYHASRPYFQRLSCGDFGLHQGNVPGYPASHGCIRVPAGIAARLFELTRTGDRVRIPP